MGAPTVPPVIPQPWANNNAALRNTIPNTTASPGLASWDQGFPSDTMQPVVAGGVPPFGQDMNGVEFALSSHDYYVQGGELFPFQSAVATAIGGYGVGAILGSATDDNVVWVNTVANNSTNPDATDGSAVGWVTMFAYGFATFNALTGATPLTLTNIQATRRFIVLNGTLTNNLTISLPGGLLQSWLVINNTTGAFTTTLKTTAGGSAGVTVPQGGFSNPLGVYSDGTNVYPTVAPLGVPISQGPDPLTLAERTNAGYILSTYFNQNSPSSENPPVGSVFVESGGDGYLRKATLAYLESVMALQSIGGQIQASQIVSAAVTQFTNLILANAALTGAPTAPTPSPGTNNTQIATTAFVTGAAALAGSNGPGTQSSFTLPNGVTVKFGQTNFFSGTNFNVAFTNPFSTMGYVAFPAAVNSSNAVYPTSVPGTGGFQIAGGSSGITCLWIAIGK